MDIIEVEVFIINSDLARCDPAGCNFFEGIARQGCLKSQKIAQAQWLYDRTDDELRSKIDDPEDYNKNIGIGLLADEIFRP
jgi:hypothetical protein